MTPMRKVFASPPPPPPPALPLPPAPPPPPALPPPSFLQAAPTKRARTTRRKIGRGRITRGILPPRFEKSMATPAMGSQAVFAPRQKSESSRSPRGGIAVDTARAFWYSGSCSGSLLQSSMEGGGFFALALRLSASFPAWLWRATPVVRSPASL